MRCALVLMPFLFLTACNDDDPGSPSGATASSGSPSSTGTSAGGAGADGGAGGSGASGATGGTGGGACDVLQAEPSLGAVTFRVTNDGDLPVYLEGGECHTTFTVTAPGIDTDNAQYIGVPCEVVTPSYRGGFPLDCDTIDSGFTVPPGGERTFEWSGVLRDNIEVPDGCGPEFPAGAYCGRAITAPAAPLTVHFRRYATLAHDEFEDTDYPTDELPPADVDFTHPTTPEVIVDASLSSN